MANKKVKVFVKVDSTYEKADGSQGFAFGLNEVDDASVEGAKALVKDNKGEYVDEADAEAAQKAAAKESDERVKSQGGSVDESLRASASQGQKFGDAFSSNASPAGDTDVSDATGETGVHPRKEEPKFRAGAEANVTRAAVGSEDSESDKSE